MAIASSHLAPQGDCDSASRQSSPTRCGRCTASQYRGDDYERPFRPRNRADMGTTDRLEDAPPPRLSHIKTKKSRRAYRIPLTRDADGWAPRPWRVPSTSLPGSSCCRYSPCHSRRQRDTADAIIVPHERPWPHPLQWREAIAVASFRIRASTVRPHSRSC